MGKLDIESDGLCLITDRLTRKYFCQVDIAEGYLFIGKKMVMFTDARYFYQAKQWLDKLSIECRLYKDNQTLLEYFNEVGAKRLFIDFSKSTVKEFFEYKKICNDICDCALIIQQQKAIKDEQEILYIKKACEITQKAYYSALKSVKKGMTEIELKDIIENLLIEFGAQDIAFETIVAFGENSAIPHHQTGNTALCDDMVILMDFGCKVNGYCSDLTRTVFFGKPTEKFCECYQKVLNANSLAIENIKENMLCNKADAIARDYFKQSHLAEYFTHSLGHGVGEEIHEYPTLSPKSLSLIKENMVFTIEPGLYFDGEFGIRIEDTVLMKHGKVQRLYDDDKKLLIL